MTELEKTLRAIARDVFADLGTGQEEKVYQRAMEVDLRLRGLSYDSERVLELRYKDHYVGEGYADLIVRDGAEIWILELKTVPGSLSDSETQQLRKYMRTLQINNGLLVNFFRPTRSRKKKLPEDGPEFENVE